MYSLSLNRDCQIFLQIGCTHSFAYEQYPKMTIFFQIAQCLIDLKHKFFSANLTSEEFYLTVVLIYISLVTNEGEYL